MLNKINTKLKSGVAKSFGFIKAHYILSSIVALAIIIPVAVSLGRGDGREFVVVKQGTIVETVRASGKIKPAEDANLGFNRGGRVLAVNVKAGDTVKAGQILVALDNSELLANLKKARAELSLQDITGSNAEVTLADAENNLIAKINDAYTKSDDAVRNYSDQFFGGTPPSLSFKRSFVEGGATIFLNIDPKAELSVVGKRTAISKMLPEWFSMLTNLKRGSDYEVYITGAKRNLETIRVFLDELSVAINNLTVPSFEYNSIFAGFRNDISSARTNVNTAITNLIAAEEKYNSAKLDASASAGNMSTQQARVLANEANVQSIEAELTQMIIRAPFEGTITKVDLSVGEIAKAGESAISLISSNKIEIESNVSEVNIGKIKASNPVRITLDAFEGREFSGFVRHVEPAETIVDNVVTYKVVVDFKEGHSDLKSGLTANLDIETFRKDDTLIVPQFAILSEGGKTYVSKLDGGKIVKTEVETGARGSDGMIEIVSGLRAGDEIEINK